MKPHDDITELALDYLNSRDSIADHVGDAFVAMPRSPLALLIDEFLEVSPNIDTAPLLHLIAEINQGRVEDLNVPAFQSYLIAKCSADGPRLRRVIAALQNFYEFKARKLDANEEPVAVTSSSMQRASGFATSFDVEKPEASPQPAQSPECDKENCPVCRVWDEGQRLGHPKRQPRLMVNFYGRPHMGSVIHYENAKCDYHPRCTPLPNAILEPQTSARIDAVQRSLKASPPRWANARDLAILLAGLDALAELPQVREDLAATNTECDALRAKLDDALRLKDALGGVNT